jgi:nickel transport protein
MMQIKIKPPKKIIQLSSMTIVWIVLILAHADLVFAHKVIIFAWVENGMIFSESHFVSKKRAKNCKITVVDEKGKIVQQGKTDENGNYSFKIPENITSDLVLKLDAGQGHQAHWKISENDIKESSNVNDIQKAMEAREKLTQGPSVYKIAAGVGIIFLFAYVLKFIQKKIYKKND